MRAISAPNPRFNEYRRASSIEYNTYFDASSPSGFCSAEFTFAKIPKSYSRRWLSVIADRDSASPPDKVIRWRTRSGFVFSRPAIRTPRTYSRSPGSTRNRNSIRFGSAGGVNVNSNFAFGNPLL